MQQVNGYAIMQMPAKLLTHYETNSFAQKYAHILQELRNAVKFVNPTHYRGISREPLSPLPTFDSDVLNTFTETGVDVETEKNARTRFLEIVGEDNPIEDYDDDLLSSLDLALEVYKLLKKPDDYEIVFLSRQQVNSTKEMRTLGFDIGYWGGDHFSLIGDTVIYPLWHPPEPQDFDELAEKLQTLNEYALFPTREAAEEFRKYYMTKIWAEKESFPGQFCIIEIGLPRL